MKKVQIIFILLFYSSIQNIMFPNSTCISRNTEGRNVLRAVCLPYNGTQEILVGIETTRYFECGYSILHFGSCQCPNNCSFHLNQGICRKLQGCFCKKEWTGFDCMTPKCPDNTCSGNGECKNNRCICKGGFTGFDCSSRVSIGIRNPLPYGEIFSNENYYSDSEKYKDYHPLFNLAEISTLNITINPDDLKYLMTSRRNLYQNIWMNINLTIHSNSNDLIFQNSRIRIKGFGTRLFQ